MHKWDSAAAPLLLCADNIRFHGCSSSYHFLSNLGGGEEREGGRKQYFIYITLWQKYLRNTKEMVLTQL